MKPWQKHDCKKCAPHNFCWAHRSRENKRPRARDCAQCKKQRKLENHENGWHVMKNKCGHHKPNCKGGDCMGCLRKDNCILCGSCDCEGDKKKLLHRCEECKVNRRALKNWWFRKEAEDRVCIVAPIQAAAP